MKKSAFLIVWVGYLIVALFFFSLCVNAHSDSLDDQLISVSIHTENTDRLVSIIKQGLSTIPRQVKRSLIKDGYRILIVPMTKDVENPSSHPHGYAEYRGWRNVAGAFASNKKQIIVAECVCRRSNLPVFNKHADETVRHEMGHAYDQYWGYFLKRKGNISASTVFRKAYSKDVHGLTESQHQEFGYFLQAGEAGRKELFAELFGKLCAKNGENTRRSREGADLVQSFPGTAKLVKDLIDRHDLQLFSNTK